MSNQQSNFTFSSPRRTAYTPHSQGWIDDLAEERVLHEQLYTPEAVAKTDAALREARAAQDRGNHKLAIGWVLAGRIRLTEGRIEPWCCIEEEA